MSRQELDTYFTKYDLKRLELYSQNMVDYHLIMDLLPTISHLHFQHHIDVHLSTAQSVRSTAQSVRSTAQSVRSTAQSVRSTAQSICSTAQSVRSTAQSVRSTAQSVRSTAQSVGLGFIIFNSCLAQHLYLGYQMPVIVHMSPYSLHPAVSRPSCWGWVYNTRQWSNWGRRLTSRPARYWGSSTGASGRWSR